MKEKDIKKIIEDVDKFKLIDILSCIYYYYVVIGEYERMLSTAELEYMMHLIYKTKNVPKRELTVEDVLSLLEFINLKLSQQERIDIENIKPDEDFIFTQARDDFLYVKEDTEYNAMVLEYLNLFHPIEYFFKTNYAFRIENFLNFTSYIQIEYTNRMRVIDNYLRRTNKDVPIEKLIEYLLTCNTSILNFNEKTLARNEEELKAIVHILQKFSTDKEKCRNIKFIDYPIYKHGNTYIFISIVTLLNRAKGIFERDIQKDKYLEGIYGYKKGEYLEILTENIMREILKDAVLFPNIKYRENKQDRECDLLVIYDQVILIVEIKGRAFKEISKEGVKSYLEQDLNDNIYKAYKQATRMENYLKENQKVSLRYANDKGKLTIQNTNKFKIFKIGITLENFRQYAIQYAEFKDNMKHDMLFFSINDLKLMAKYFNYQTEFIHYISQRIKTNPYIHEFSLYNELYLFSEYKINNLQSILNNDHRVKVFDTGRYKLFDLRFDTERKKQILKGYIHPFFQEMVEQLEKQKIPSYSLTIMELLDIDYQTQEYIFKQLIVARQKFKETNQPVNASLLINEARDANGVYIVFGVTNKQYEKDSIEATIILGSIIKRKYPKYKVLGILNNMDDKPENLMACIEIMDPKPEIDKAIERVEEFKNFYLTA